MRAWCVATSNIASRAERAAGGARSVRKEGCSQGACRVGGRWLKEMCKTEAAEGGGGETRLRKKWFGEETDRVLVRERVTGCAAHRCFSSAGGEKVRWNPVDICSRNEGREKERGTSPCHRAGGRYVGGTAVPGPGEGSAKAALWTMLWTAGRRRRTKTQDEARHGSGQRHGGQGSRITNAQLSAPACG